LNISAVQKNLGMAWGNEALQFIRSPSQGSGSNSDEVTVKRRPRRAKKKSDKNAVDTKVHHANEFEKTNRFIAWCVYFNWMILFIFAYIREFLRKHGLEKNLAAVELPKQRSFVPLFAEFEAIYSRNCYMRVRDVFERPIGSVPGATVKLIDRYTEDYCWSFKFTGSQTEVINMGSYNYLGFAQKDGPCAEAASRIIDDQGLSLCTSVHERGFSKSQRELEKLLARFIGVEDAICFSMGFATNSMNLPCLADKNTLIISDQYNHASLVLGCRMSGATIRIFRHDDVCNLENLICAAIRDGNPKTGYPFRKILIIIEGIYSMEGSICNLPEIIALKKKYGAYLYLDEAHSIGALGATGRGVVEYWGCDPYDVDILMGTFTKSFGAAGGYIAGRKKIIDHIRTNTATGVYAPPMSPPVAQQIYSCMSIIMGLDGTQDGARRIEQLKRNTHYFRKHLKRMGLIVYGSDDSPVVPILIYYPTKCGLWGREMLKRQIGVVVVSFPATDMVESRVRVCLSAAHTKPMLDKTLQAIYEVSQISNIKYSKGMQQYDKSPIEW
uniref:serine C-palmitoyltransferase n=1 Tax=Anisakis simplex TaxID=6269 RepID=A0A0M3JYI2_ANISI